MMRNNVLRKCQVEGKNGYLHLCKLVDHIGECRKCTSKKEK